MVAPVRRLYYALCANRKRTQGPLFANRIRVGKHRTVERPVVSFDLCSSTNLVGEIDLFRNLGSLRTCLLLAAAAAAAVDVVGVVVVVVVVVVEAVN